MEKSNLENTNEVSQDKTTQNTSSKFSSPIKFFTFLVIVLLLVSVFIGVQLIKSSQDLRGRAAPTQKIQKPDAGQEPNEDQIKKAQEETVEDHNLDSLIINKVKGVTTDNQSATDVLGTTLPVVRIESPSDGSILPTYAAVRIAASASHPSGIQSIEIYINNVRVSPDFGCKTTTCTLWRGFSQSPVGVYKIKAVAFSKDSPPTSAEASITTYKNTSSTPPTGYTPPPTNNPTAVIGYPTPTSTRTISTPSPTSSSSQSDRTPPTLTINSPANGTTFLQPSLYVHSNSSDTSGISNMTISVDSVMKATCYTSICAYSAPSGSIIPGSHTVTVSATDRATPVQNTTTKSVTVTYQQSIPTAGVTGTVTLPPGTFAPPPPISVTPGQYPIITGSTAYVSAIKGALNLMKSRGPSYYALVMQYVREIKEGSNLAYVSSGVIQVSTVSSKMGPGWAGGTIVHETYHVYNFRRGIAYKGCEGEANSLRPQAAYLRLVGEPEFAKQIEALIGIWC